MSFAIVGMDCVLPGAPDAEAWIARSRTGEPALGPVPDGRWPFEPASALHPDGPAPDRTTTTTGGFVTDFAFDPTGLDLDVPAERLDPLAQWVLHSCRGALSEAKLTRAATDVVLANLSLPSTGAVRAAAPPYRRALHLSDWLDGSEPLDRWQSGMPAQLAARALGLGGAAFALDAACASGLYAVRVAIDRLAAGLCDAAIAVGVQRADSSYLFLGFSQLLALSPTGTPRPLDARADGLCVGEGAAAVLIKRLDDAVRDGDTIHAVLHGGGLGNDGKSGNLLAPNSGGQLRTLRAAWSDAGVPPADLGYVECHATGTVLGDRTEVAALSQLLGADHAPVVLGSTKGIVGHTITVAGLAGLIRTVGAVRDGWLPATPWASEPSDAVREGPFELLDQPRKWTGRRLAAVSAFGFGGTNAHIVVEAPPARTKASKASEASKASKASRGRPSRTASSPRIAVVGIAATLGHESRLTTIGEVLRGRGTLRRPFPPSATRGLGPLPDGAWVASVTADAAALRIPPSELANVLPQQLLMLVTAARALDDAPSVDPARTASVIGMGIDLHVAEQVLRWCTDSPAARDALAPVLTSSRVQGSLPNFCANRIAACFGLEGPSLTVSAGEHSGPVALEQAARLLASGAVDAAVAGAVDLPGHVGAQAAARMMGDSSPAEGAVAFVLKRRDDAIRDGDPIYAVLRGFGSGGDPRTAQDRALSEASRSAPGVHAVCAGDRAPAELRLGPETAIATHRDSVGHGEALDGAISLLQAVVAANLPPGQTPLGWAEAGRLVAVSSRSRAGTWHHTLIESPPDEHRRSLADTPDPAPRTPVTVPHSGPPVFVPDTGWFDQGPAPEPVVLRGAEPVAQPPVLHWPWSTEAPREPASPSPSPQPAFDAGPTLPAAPTPSRVDPLVAALEANTAAMTAAHAQFLASERNAHQQIREIAWLTSALLDGGPLPTVQARPAARQPRPIQPPAPAPAQAQAPTAPARRFDLQALRAFAAGPLSSCLGPSYADLDHYEPRVRLPLDPLLLVSRVTDIEGTRGELGPSRIVTEYDLDPQAAWAQDGKPPPSVVVESGQADLFLVSYLGIDELCQGERLYRLLDCDLTFHDARPSCGETLRHDIRIKRFARLGGTTLFYFEYDCTAASDGRPILTMRNGCAGFFTPAELATPQGCDTSPSPTTYRGPLLGTLPTGSRNLDAPGIAALTEGTTLKLPQGDWGLVHRVRDLQLTGGPHGLGGLVAEQDLSDDDWFNAAHFLGDPCMPGTLMFDGCMQAVQVWLLATGIGRQFPEATFEPMVETAALLRCRGQVVPGHSKLEYEVRIKDAALDGEPYALADVILHVDGIAVVRAEDVGVRVVGDRVRTTLPDRAHFLNHAVGSHEAAFGPAVRHFDLERRGPRIPGPPLQFLHRAEAVSSRVGERTAPAQATVAYDVPAEAWYWSANPGVSMPLAVFLETALQPCGWFTAWQGCAASSPHDLYFRNLGGTLELVREVGPHEGTLRTTATLTSLSESAGMILTFFDLEVRDPQGALVARGDTHFGYFTKSALAGQSGLPEADALPIPPPNLSTPIDLSKWTGRGAPRDDARMLDRVTHADPAAGVYAAELDVHDDAWFFTAHFHEDPVMPGSLGLEALTQLARWALLDGGSLRSERHRIQPLATGRKVSWKYRGQVLRGVERVHAVFEVTERTETGLFGRGTIYADDLPIYRFDDFGVAIVEGEIAGPTAPAPTRDLPRTAALLDEFTVDGSVGYGTLELDPQRHPWLRDHCPTLVIPAVPMAFAAEIAAEAALQLRPDHHVVGIPELEAKRWLHGEDGSATVLVTAVAEGDAVAVTLSRQVENRRYPALSGPREHMRAIVQLARQWPDAPPVPAPLPDAQPVELTARAYYSEGHTFHGPVLQGMTDLGRRSSTGAEATFRTRADTELVPDAPGFVLDPLLLDCATHPMMSSTPELWVEGLAPGKLAYPVEARDMRFYGPRPQGEVQCRLDLVAASAQTLAFEVTLHTAEAVWCTFTWTEALVDGGLLGAPADVIRRFCKGDEPLQVEIPTTEPIEGTLVRLLGTAQEHSAWQAAPDRQDWLQRWLTAKQAVRAHVRTELGRDLHPRRFEVCELGERWAVTEAFDLTADELVGVLHPTVFLA